MPSAIHADTTLETLHHIVQAVNAAPDLETALSIIVQKVKKATAADVCSVYLTYFELRQHVLKATDGLRPEAVGRVSLPLYRGLVGLVCERAEPVNLANAVDHPRYMRVVETGETQYRAFLGVPIIQHRKVLGVVVIRQTEERLFAEQEVTFLFTLAAQLAGAITHARASGELDELRDSHAPHDKFIRGRPGSSGVALGVGVVVYPPADLTLIPDRAATDPQHEMAQLRMAAKAVAQELEDMRERVRDTLAKEDLALFEAWQLMVESESLLGDAEQEITKGLWAQAALRNTIEAHARVFEAMEDHYFRERATDVRDLGRRILQHLQAESALSRPQVYPEHTILVGDEVSAIQLAEVPPGLLAGVVSVGGSGSSHVAILARAMGLPAVMGTTDLPVGRLDGRDLIIDGHRGRVYVSPDDNIRQEYQNLLRKDQELSREMEDLAEAVAETPDGQRFHLYLNTGLIAEASTRGAEQAAGVGLYRTELPFMVRNRFPSEEDQSESYRLILEAFAPRPVTMRTLDIGGDKPLPYFAMKEANPFLGWRGIRVSLDHPEIFLTQIRAMLRASTGLNNLRVLLPMISHVGEVDDALLLIQRAHAEIREEGINCPMPPLGVMIEVPAAVYQVEALARRVDFLSIGTNDLTQYLLAVDRNNADVAELFDELHPAVLKALFQVVEGARLFQREVSVCGEMAGNPLAIPLLMGMDIHHLSLNSGSLLKVKWVVRSFSRAQSKELLRAALRCEDARTVRRIMIEALENQGLGRLIQTAG